MKGNESREKGWIRKLEHATHKEQEEWERLESGQEGGMLERLVGMGAGGWDWLAREKGLTWGEREGRKGDFDLDSRLRVDD